MFMGACCGECLVTIETKSFKIASHIRIRKDKVEYLEYSK